MKKRTMLIIAAVVAVGAMAVYLIITFYLVPKIQPGQVPDPVKSYTEKAPENEVPASVSTVTEWFEAVGTVRPRTESRIESQITATVLKVNVSPGQKVSDNELLIVLDSRHMTSRLDQAREGLKTAQANKKQAQHVVAASEAAFDQARAAYQRVKKYYDSQAATAQDLEQAEAAYLQAQAAVKRAKEGLSAAEALMRQAEEVIEESQIALEYSQIKAPATGEVLKRLAEPGDLALPGKPLLILQTTGALRLEAYVREGLIKKIHKNATFDAVITTLDTVTSATVDEIVPYADPMTRTFLVKATLPVMEGLYPGMYGKLLIPVEELQVVMIPQTAVRTVGQLELVKVKQGEKWQTRYIKTGTRRGDKVEVLSGLSGSEMIGY